VTGSVYAITNNLNGKRYIGRTVRSLAVRFAQHVRDETRARIGATKRANGDSVGARNPRFGKKISAEEIARRSATRRAKRESSHGC
jgi:phage protein D